MEFRKKKEKKEKKKKKKNNKQTNLEETSPNLIDQKWLLAFRLYDI